LPPKALKLIAVDYQEGLLERLNTKVRDTPLKNMSVVQTIIDAATDPHKVTIFNYASEALNNSYFLESMKPHEANLSSHEDEISQSLLNNIKSNFGSLKELKSTFGATVNGMFSSGFVWLVCDQLGGLAVFPTFGTGTLLVRSRQPVVDENKGVVAIGELPGGGIPSRQPAPEQATAQTPDVTPLPTSPASGLSHQPPTLPPSTPSRAYSTSTPRFSLPNLTPSSIHDASIPKNTPHPAKRSESDLTLSGQHLFPLFCLSVHEHAWLSAGYGVWGKEEYVKRFWSVVDWEAASRTFAKHVPASKR